MIKKLTEFIAEQFLISRTNRVPNKFGGGNIFQEPLIGVSAGDDPIYKTYKKVVGPSHMTPVEIWLSMLHKKIDPSGLRVVSIIFPYVDEIRQAGKKTLDLPDKMYCLSRNLADTFMNEVMNRSISFFKKEGYEGIAGMLHPDFNILVDLPTSIYSTWSERHAAFAAGLGTFSLHEGFISEKGCNIRIASVITNAPLEITRRKSDDPFANCLFYATGKCRKCEKRCPGEAIDQEGHNKLNCHLYGQKVAEVMKKELEGELISKVRRVNGEKQEPVYPVGCALCQFAVPCTSKNPMASKQTGKPDIL